MNELVNGHDGEVLAPITRAKVFQLENLIKQYPQHVTRKDIPVFHHFLPGMYIRELHIPNDTVLTGAIHKYPCLSILSKGTIRVLINEHVETVSAPYLTLSPAGMKRAGYTLEETIWITVHSNPQDITDIEQIDKYLTCDNEEDYQAFLARQDNISWHS